MGNYHFWSTPVTRCYIFFLQEGIVIFYHSFHFASPLFSFFAAVALTADRSTCESTFRLGVTSPANVAPGLVPGMRSSQGRFSGWVLQQFHEKLNEQLYWIYLLILGSNWTQLNFNRCFCTDSPRPRPRYFLHLFAISQMISVKALCFWVSLGIYLFLHLHFRNGPYPSELKSMRVSGIWNAIIYPFNMEFRLRKQHMRNGSHENPRHSIASFIPRCSISRICGF